MGFFRRHGEEDTSSGPEVRVEILGKPTVLKDADCWLRALQRVAAEDSSLVFHGGFYCWNNRCKRCFLSIEPGGEGPAVKRQACLIKPADGDRITALPMDMDVRTPTESATDDEVDDEVDDGQGEMTDEDILRRL